MARYMTKPKIKEAEQFFADKLPHPFSDEGACYFDTPIGGWCVITTHGQGTRIADGDYIVREPDGNGFYPCKPGIFEAGHTLI
jgi:hypothetical protein